MKKTIIILALMLCGILFGCTKNDTEPADDNKQEDPKPEPKPEPEKYISFQDYTVKQICISMWDTNGDGKFSEKEAAAVRSIGNVFTNKKIYRFDELKYFTRITELPDDAFLYYEKTGTVYIEDCFLKSITIPANVRKIGYNAFACDSGCRITMESLTPPKVDDEYFIYYRSSDNISICVRNTQAYKSADGWKEYSSNIVGY